MTILEQLKLAGYRRYEPSVLQPRATDLYQRWMYTEGGNKMFAINVHLFPDPRYISGRRKQSRAADDAAEADCQINTLGGLTFNVMILNGWKRVSDMEQYFREIFATIDGELA